MIALWFLVCCLVLVGTMFWCMSQDLVRPNLDINTTPAEIELARIATSMADEYEQRYQPLRKGGE